MEDSKITKVKKDGRGGPRPNSGRPKGSVDRVTVASLLEAFDAASGGRRYEAVLFEDFFRAREEGDRVMAHKYHNLILNKLAPTMVQAEVNSTISVEDQAQAFVEAMRAVIDQQSPDSQQDD